MRIPEVSRPLSNDRCRSSPFSTPLSLLLPRRPSNRALIVSTIGSVEKPPYGQPSVQATVPRPNILSDYTAPGFTGRAGVSNLPEGLEVDCKKPSDSLFS